MTKRQPFQTSFTDAYSFHYYGAKNWQECIDMLFARGYNSVEVECIMRSVMTRYATDNVTGRRKATAADLADLMDNRMGGPVSLRNHIDEIVADTMAQAHQKMHSRDALRLAWSR